MSAWSDFAYTFIPIFVAMDVGGLIPVFLSLTQGLSEAEKKRVGVQALWTSFLISGIFIAVGRYIFLVLGITVYDFQIGGGILLLVLAVADLLYGGAKRKVRPGSQVGVVPLGIPLIIGPAVLTSLIILIGLRGYTMTFAALLVNLMLVAVAFHQSRRLMRWIGEEGLRASSQVVSLFLAAIAVSMIRRGILAIR